MNASGTDLVVAHASSGAEELAYEGDGSPALAYRFERFEERR